MTIDPVTLLVNGLSYGGWQDISIERGVDRAVSSFNISVSERWGGSGCPWSIKPFEFCEVYAGSDKMLTGYVESYTPAFDASSHGVRITGHSKTKDLVDCNPDVPSGQFSGFTLAAIARAIGDIFNVGVIVDTDRANQVVQNTNMDRCDTAFSFLERLGRLTGVLMCDDEQGNLVLTTAGRVKSSSTLVQGENILAAHGMLNSAQRFSQYILKGQAGIGYGSTLNLDGAGGIPAAHPTGTVQTAMRASVFDADVPRYRPKVTLAESQMPPAQMQQRVNWQKQYAYGQATKAMIRVHGFRQADGTLWQINQMVSCTVPWLSLDADLLVARVKFSMNSSGHSTELDLGPVEGYTPDPGEVKALKGKKGHKTGGFHWTGAGGNYNPATSVI